MFNKLLIVLLLLSTGFVLQPVQASTAHRLHEALEELRRLKSAGSGVDPVLLERLQKSVEASGHRPTATIGGTTEAAIAALGTLVDTKEERDAAERTRLAAEAERDAATRKVAGATADLGKAVRAAGHRPTSTLGGTAAAAVGALGTLAETEAERDDLKLRVAGFTDLLNGVPGPGTPRTKARTLIADLEAAKVARARLEASLSTEKDARVAADTARARSDEEAASAKAASAKNALDGSTVADATRERDEARRAVAAKETERAAAEAARLAEEAARKAAEETLAKLRADMGSAPSKEALDAAIAAKKLANDEVERMRNVVEELKVEMRELQLSINARNKENKELTAEVAKLKK